MSRVREIRPWEKSERVLPEIRRTGQWRIINRGVHNRRERAVLIKGILAITGKAFAQDASLQA